jgi:signal peptidase
MTDRTQDQAYTWENPWAPAPRQYLRHGQATPPRELAAGWRPARAQWLPQDFHSWPELDDAEDVEGLPDLLPPLPQPREAAARGRDGRGARLLFNALFCLLIAAIVGGAAFFAFSGNPRKSFFGYRLYTVKTPSMTPRADGSSPPGGFRAGDAILVKLCEPEALRPGDIVTYVPGSDPSVYLTHRVVRVLDRLGDDAGVFFVTRGDANDADDPPIHGGMVIGKKVLAVPGLGVGLQFLRDNLFLSLVRVGSCVGFAVLLRMYFSDRYTPPSRKKAVTYIK